ncbi:MAG: type 1 glutamine amidotransferase [Haloarculaceae archaeon]
MSDRPRLALLNASHSVDPTRRNFRRELDADLAEFVLTEEQYPDGFDYDGFVVTGSASSVYWDEPWLPATREWVAEAIDRGIPALGVCFGHQLLADVLGGTVEDMGEYELGYRTVRRTDAGREDPIHGDLDDEFFVFTTHSDAVTELPPGASLTAENDHGIHGFRHDHVFGMQSHPEYDLDTARSVAEGKESEAYVSDEQLSAVLEDVTESNFSRAAETKRIFDDFLAYVREVRAAPAAGD